jgi:hypothetical protein
MCNEWFSDFPRLDEVCNFEFIPTSDFSEEDYHTNLRICLILEDDITKCRTDKTIPTKGDASMQSVRSLGDDTIHLIGHTATA